jgi:hypothetical protein
MDTRTIMVEKYDPRPIPRLVDNLLVTVLDAGAKVVTLEPDNLAPAGIQIKYLTQDGPGDIKVGTSDKRNLAAGISSRFKRLCGLDLTVVGQVQCGMVALELSGFDEVDLWISITPGKNGGENITIFPER